MAPLTPKDRRVGRDAEIYELHDLKLSEREIAKRVGCSRTTVWDEAADQPYFDPLWDRYMDGDR